MLKKICGTSFCLFVLSLNAKPTELKLVTISASQKNIELSGLVYHSGKLLTVADKGDQHFLYEISWPIKNNKYYNYKPHMDLKKLSGSKKVDESIEKTTEVSEKNRRFDLEGLTTCGTEVFIANERVRQVIKVNTKNKTVSVPVVLKDQGVFEGSANAGFEGIAADCKSEILYIAKERDPSFILSVSLKNSKVLGKHTFERSNRIGQKVINPWNGDGLFTINEDIAGLKFHNGFLYVLERNTSEVAKVNPKTWKVESRVSFFQVQKNLYETGEPFGVAEALEIIDNKIVIGFDNNNTPLTHSSHKNYNLKGTGAIIAVFEKPKDF